VRFSLLALVLVLPLSASTRAQSAPSKPEVVPYRATIDVVKYVYGVAAPVARLKPGNILEANSLDCFGNAIKKPGDALALANQEAPVTAFDDSRHDGLHRDPRR